jgi:hypothetical protein
MAAPLKPWQRRMRLAGWAIIALFAAGVAAFALKLRHDIVTYVDEPELLPAGVSFSTADYIISEVLFTAEDIKFYAYRWGPEERFRIVVLRPGEDGVEECSGGEAFDRWFFQTTELYVGPALEVPVANKASDWAVFELSNTRRRSRKMTRACSCRRGPASRSSSNGRTSPASIPRSGTPSSSRW